MGELLPSLHYRDEEKVRVGKRENKSECHLRETLFSTKTSELKDLIHSYLIVAYYLQLNIKSN